jgi:hypothetical protein
MTENASCDQQKLNQTSITRWRTIDVNLFMYVDSVAKSTRQTFTISHLKENATLPNKISHIPTRVCTYYIWQSNQQQSAHKLLSNQINQIKIPISKLKALCLFAKHTVSLPHEKYDEIFTRTAARWEKYMSDWDFVLFSSLSFFFNFILANIKHEESTTPTLCLMYDASSFFLTVLCNCPCHLAEDYSEYLH